MDTSLKINEAIMELSDSSWFFREVCLEKFGLEAFVLSKHDFLI